MNEKLNFNWEKPKDSEEPGNPDIKNYDAPAEVRHVTFILPSGESHTYYYFELRKLVFEPQGQKLTLTFANDTITLQGRNLEALCQAMRNYAVQEIRVTEERYVAMKGDDEILVLNVAIQLNP